MTKKELIDKLKDYEDDIEVCLNGYITPFSVAVPVGSIKKETYCHINHPWYANNDGESSILAIVANKGDYKQQEVLMLGR